MATQDSTPKIKLKKRKVCSDSFQLFRSTQKVCSPGCAIKLAQVGTAKKSAKAHTKAKKELKDNDRSFQLKKTQTIFNRFIRLRDSDLPCISCQRFHEGRYDAGHYLSAGAYPALRFHPLNCHKQCHYNCNINRSGNIAEYRIHLVKKIGLQNLGWLEGPHEPKRYTITNLKTIQKWFKRKTKRMERDL